MHTWTFAHHTKKFISQCAALSLIRVIILAKPLYIFSLFVYDVCLFDSSLSVSAFEIACLCTDSAYVLDLRILDYFLTLLYCFCLTIACLTTLAFVFELSPLCLINNTKGFTSLFSLSAILVLHIFWLLCRLEGGQSPIIDPLWRLKESFRLRLGISYPRCWK